MPQEEHMLKRAALITGILAVVVGAFSVWLVLGRQSSSQPRALSQAEQIQQKLDALKGEATTTPTPAEIQKQLKALSAGTKAATAPISSTTIQSKLESLK